LFPITSYVPASECPHRGPIRDTIFVCGVCWASAWDRHPDLQVSRRDRPRRTRRIAAIIPMPTLETRRQRRAREFGHRRAAAAE
jgi:hypothetical protein